MMKKICRPSITINDLTYNPDLAWSDSIVSNLKEFLVGNWFDNDEELKETVTDYLNGLSLTMELRGLLKDSSNV